MMKIICPESFCRAVNELDGATCVNCSLPLREYAKLLTYPNHLFNLGLDKAKAGQLGQARDLFAAVVYWYPKDLEARNALAAASFELGDYPQANQQWEIVFQCSSLNTLARSQAMQGLDVIRTIGTVYQAPDSTQTPPLHSTISGKQRQDKGTMSNNSKNDKGKQHRGKQKGKH